MSEQRENGGDAFPTPYPCFQGMSLRDWFAGQALANAEMCSGHAHEYQLKTWFGGRNGIKREEIIAAQAYALADAMLEARDK